MHNLFYIAVLLTAAVLVPEPAHAYIGPGAGLSVIGTLIAVIGAFLLLIVGFVWYPVKRMLKRKQATGAVENSDPNNSEQ